MFLTIKNRIERELVKYIKSVDKLHSFSSISPLLFSSIKEFLCRKGKRVRPILFLIGYLGYAKKAAKGVYRSAISLELLHDFMLVHDDIIDKSDTRRGNPSMHAMFNNFLRNHKKAKFSGEDLTIVAGDIMYAMALHAFLSVKEDAQRKEQAMQKLITAALYTGSGEFAELLNGLKGIDELKKNDIFKIYDLKTANYTFASPLAIGATLAGAPKKEVDNLFAYGIYIGRAFQIKDDIIGIFSKESEIGKPNLTDLREGKITILIWQAYRNSGRKERQEIKKIFSKKRVDRNDLLIMRGIITQSGALAYAKKEVEKCIAGAEKIIQASLMRPHYKQPLHLYTREILKT